MTNKKTTLMLIINEFPDHNHIVEDLYRESDSFRYLCKDYHDCLKVLDHLQVSKEMMDKGIEEEYKELKQELEEELTMWINL